MVSIVLVSRNDGASLKRTVDELLAATPGAELVVVDDRSDDGGADFLTTGYRGVRLLRLGNPLGMAAKWNVGASVATGDILVFAAPRVVVDRDWMVELTTGLEPTEVGAVGPALVPMARPGDRLSGLIWTDASLNLRWLRCRGTGPYPVPLLTSHCIALRRDVFASLGGFDVGMLLRGGATVELCLRLWRCGYECRVAPGSVVITRLGAAPRDGSSAKAALHDNLRLGIIHLSEDRLEQLVSARQGQGAFAAAMARAADGDAGRRRASMQASSIYDDDWFFDRFGMD